MRTWMKRILLSALALLLAGAAFITYEMQTGNFHEIVAGEFYRSSQPSASDLERYVKEHGIKSVINLRGENANAPWYQDEIRAAAALDVKFINFRMKAARELTTEHAFELIAVMKKAPKPLLIHCRAGADRTGLASALYLAGVAKKPEEEAEEQLSIRYGHLPYYPFWWTEAQAMYRTFERMEPLLGYKGS